MIMYAEPWGEIPRMLLLGAACGVVAGAVGLAGVHYYLPIAVSAVGFTIAVIGGIQAHAHHNIVEIQLTASTLILPQRTISLASVRGIEVRGLPHHLESGHREYQQRIVRLKLGDNTSVRVPLPMETAPGDHFARILEERIAVVRSSS
jgi:hypothetical protein